jgi:outer membrane protein|tara:strand:+ start:386 stop:907 length:522 start_codon:yes stop_codon:yes gene_type:complete
MFKKNFYFLLVLIIFLNNNVLAKSTFAYIDMNNILINSKVGKSLIDQLKKENDIIKKRFLDNELELNTEEKKILLKKNVLSNDEFNKKISILKKKILTYNNSKQNAFNEQNQKRINYQEKIISLLNPILIDYMNEHSISLIFKKKSMIVAPKELNITKEIIERLNKKISKLKF